MIFRCDPSVLRVGNLLLSIPIEREEPRVLTFECVIVEYSTSFPWYFGNIARAQRRLRLFCSTSGEQDLENSQSKQKRSEATQAPVLYEHRKSRKTSIDFKPDAFSLDISYEGKYEYKAERYRTAELSDVFRCAYGAGAYGRGFV